MECTTPRTVLLLAVLQRRNGFPGDLSGAVMPAVPGPARAVEGCGLGSSQPQARRQLLPPSAPHRTGQLAGHQQRDRQAARGLLAGAGVQGCAAAAGGGGVLTGAGVCCCCCGGRLPVALPLLRAAGTRGGQPFH